MRDIGFCEPISPLAPHGAGCGCQAGGLRFSRRSLLVSAGAALMAPPRVFAQAAAPMATSSPRRIDTHFHIFPPFYVEAARDAIIRTLDTNPQPALNWSPQFALAEMDKNGVETGIASLVPGILWADKATARRLVRQYHDYCARLVADYPKRFGFFASLPLSDIEGSLAEIAYAFDTCKADGVMLHTNYDDKWPGDPAFDAVFSELNRRKTVVFFHPTVGNCCKALMPKIPPSTMEYLFDSTRAAASLLVNGVYAKYPDIKFIFSHTGGALSVIANRMDRFVARHPELAETMPDGSMTYLRRQYFDIANSVNAPVMAAARAFVPASQLLFGSDFPVIPFALTVNDYNKYELPQSERSSIDRANALRLFPKLA